MTPRCRLDLGMVREFVIAGHGNLDRTRELLEQEPALINATWDWGRGDWETALGGASHMGNQPIAEFLLANGARMDVFCATMMGKIEIVGAFLADDPSVVDLKGPHGIPLIPATPRRASRTPSWSCCGRAERRDRARPEDSHCNAGAQDCAYME